MRKMWIPVLVVAAVAVGALVLVPKMFARRTTAAPGTNAAPVPRTGKKTIVGKLATGAEGLARSAGYGAAADAFEFLGGILH